MGYVIRGLAVALVALLAGCASTSTSTVRSGFDLKVLEAEKAHAALPAVKRARAQAQAAHERTVMELATQLGFLRAASPADRALFIAVATTDKSLEASSGVPNRAGNPGCSAAAVGG